MTFQSEQTFKKPLEGQVAEEIERAISTADRILSHTSLHRVRLTRENEEPLWVRASEGLTSTQSPGPANLQISAVSRTLRCRKRYTKKVSIFGLIIVKLAETE